MKRLAAAVFAAALILCPVPALAEDVALEDGVSAATQNTWGGVSLKSLVRR